VLEVGAGTGYVAEKLVRSGYRRYLIGDLFREALKYTQQTLPDVPMCQFDIFHPPFASDFDAVFLFDVIEHLDDDAGAMRNIADSLGVGGVVVLTVPAHQWLWHADDRAGGHKRRYSAESMATLLRGAGFEVEESTYIFRLIVPLLLLRRVLDPDKGPSNTPLSDSFFDIGKIANAVLKRVSKVDFRLGRILPNRVGGSLLVVARRVG